MPHEKPRRHPGLEFEKYHDALHGINSENAEETKRNAPEGFQGLSKWIAVLPVECNFSGCAFQRGSTKQNVSTCSLMQSCNMFHSTYSVLPCLQDIAFGSTAFSCGTRATLNCRFTSFRWRRSGVAPSKSSSQMPLTPCAKQCES